MEITLPHNFLPRVYQEPAWKAMEEGVTRIVCVWHRRSGKDLTFIHKGASECFRRRGLYWHLLPTYSQGRKIVWNGMDKTGKPFLDAFPEGTYYRKRDDEMTLWLHGGSIYQVVGTDHIDRLVGGNPVGCIFSEYSLQNPAAWELIRPILAENGGWAVFIYTPRSRNHGWKLLQRAIKNERWFAQVLTVDDTGAVSQEAIDDDRESGMPEEMVQQEYYCSFDAALVGAYYGQVLEWLRNEGRIREVSWIPNVPVVTGFDLGKADSTAIWFAQHVAGEWRIIDYEEHSGEDPPFYMNLMQSKRYVLGEAYMPHDATQKKMGQERSVLQQFQDLGLQTTLIGKSPIPDQIAAGRVFLRQCFIDEEKCERGLLSLMEYVKKPIPDERGPDNEVLFRDEPKHNWASHGASALASLALGARTPMGGPMPQPDTGFVT